MQIGMNNKFIWKTLKTGTFPRTQLSDISINEIQACFCPSTASICTQRYRMSYRVIDALALATLIYYTYLNRLIRQIWFSLIHPFRCCNSVYLYVRAVNNLRILGVALQYII